MTLGLNLVFFKSSNYQYDVEKHQQIFFSSGARGEAAAAPRTPTRPTRPVGPADFGEDGEYPGSQASLVLFIYYRSCCHF